ncbi:cupredoxin domain-containing protein [Fodinibius sp.]|uniref:cupredoxin domain-containing protein n=1 Tax=Fodinibius sp. TaxID=1872440 RepID=UPI002ACD7CC6|nr:plastocyanin/azurin family copper-binding protein [Fodinibius sp.]MDZ7659520.1 plastocyanin/azurin family copper-binding protein [Fodinibius sp.]
MLISSHRNVLLTIVVSLFLIIAGCGDSSTDSGEKNNNQNQSASFSSGLIAPGETFSYTFEEEETVDYYCTIHTPNMTGQITVTSSADPVDRDTVSMENNQFVPENLEVAPNTEVVWVNNQDHDHDIKTGTPSSDGNGDY